MICLSGKKITIPFHKPDLKEKIFFFISGIALSVPFTLVFQNLSNRLCVLLPVFYANICSIAIFAPFIEEFAKAYPLFYRHGETEKTILTFGFLIGLGFGITELFIYVFLRQVPIIFRIPGAFFHAASTIILGYGIVKKNPIKFYLIAVLLHFLNNYFALLGRWWYIGGLPAVIIAYLLAWRLYQKTEHKMIGAENNKLKTVN